MPPLPPAPEDRHHFPSPHEHVLTHPPTHPPHSNPIPKRNMPAHPPKLLSFSSSSSSSPLPAPFHTGRGVPYHPLWHLVPFLSPFYSSYEKNFDAAPSFLFLYNHTYLPLLAVALYLGFCFYGPKYMKHRKAFDLKGPMCLWNLALSIVRYVGWSGWGGWMGGLG